MDHNAPMDHNARQMLAATGFAPAQTERYLAFERAGRRDECLRMLRCQRCALVEALHEAQRPIDVIDYAIYELQRAHG
jgi:hypothetical protein